ncbi:MAG: hypothetical protein LBV60_22850, partial [Streptomyces sp.]|nr:hypothetical protein [Streptomyces sp.]
MTKTGEVRAKATFTAPVVGGWTNAAPVLQPYARVANGLIFYVNAQGTISSLAPDGSVKRATNLTLRPGQNIISFAVSPDGRKIAASILNYPPPHNPPPQSISDPFLEPGEWWYDYATATVGQAAQRVVSRDLGTYPQVVQPNGITTVVGWDQRGPVAVTDTTLATQGGILSSLTPGMALVNLGADGSHLDQIGGAGCIPLDTTVSGDVICYSSNAPGAPGVCPAQYLVNSATGATLWSASLNGCVSNPRLSPESDRFCTDSGVVHNKSGTTTSLPQSSLPQSDTCQGWVDDSTVVLFGAGQAYTFEVTSQARITLINGPGVRYLGTSGGS